MEKLDIVSFVLHCGRTGIISIGNQYLSSGAAALVNSTIPIWVAIFVLMFFRKIPTRLGSAGIVTGFVGLIILVLPTIEGGGSSWIGIIFLTISSISWAMGSIYSNPVRDLVLDGLFFCLPECLC